jgi:hypothetical protein
MNNPQSILDEGVAGKIENQQQTLEYMNGTDRNICRDQGYVTTDLNNG